MQTIQEIVYELTVNYKNNNGDDVECCMRINDSGLETKSIQVGDTRITKETINGRVLSGRYEQKDILCGYVYDYSKYELPVSINENSSVQKAEDLIEETRKRQDFHLADSLIMYVSICKDKILSLKEVKDFKLTKTIIAKTAEEEELLLQEITMFKLKDKQYYSEESKQRIYKIDNSRVDMQNGLNKENDEHKFEKLIDILDKKPKNYLDLSLENKNTTQADSF